MSSERYLLLDNSPAGTKEARHPSSLEGTQLMRRILVSIVTLATASVLTLVAGATGAQAARLGSLPPASGLAVTTSDSARHEVTVTSAGPRGIPPVELGRDHYVRLRLKWGKCAEMPGWSKKNYTQADVWTCKNQANVKWYVTFAGTYGSWDTYYIKNSSSKKCLNVAGRSYKNGTKIIQYTCSNALNNRWVFAPHADYYELKSVATNGFINVAGGKAANGAKLVQWNTFGHANQDFFFDLV